MKSERDGGVLTVFPLGRLDTVTAETVEAEIRELMGEPVPEALRLDMSGVSYVTSAGLRVFLRLNRDYGHLTMTEVSPEIMDIFEMTGISQIIPAEKAFRRVSIDGCEVVGEGTSGKVYRLDPETILKVYPAGYSLKLIRAGQELTKKAFILGLPTAIPYDVVRVGDSYGAVFELLDAKPLRNLLTEDPGSVEKCAALTSSLMKQIHSTRVGPGEMRDLREDALRRAEYVKKELTPSAYGKLRELLCGLPVSGTLVHGDLHIKNVLVQNGETLIIDMDTLQSGDPIYEFAAIYQAYAGFGELNPEANRQLYGVDNALCEKLVKRTVCLYLGTEEESACEEVLKKARLITYFRLLADLIRYGKESKGERENVLWCRKTLEECLEKTDDLCLPGEDV